jgi:hypothetical protein
MTKCLNNILNEIRVGVLGLILHKKKTRRNWKKRRKMRREKSQMNLSQKLVPHY